MSFRLLSSLRLPGSILIQLTSAGYTTIQDLQAIPAETLAQDLRLSLSEAETILSLCQKPPLTQSLGQPTLTQSAASISTNHKISTGCPPVDNLLSGGISRGQIIEISGPPGTPKIDFAISIVKSFVKVGHEAIFIDCQNMTSPATLDRAMQTPGAAPQDYSRRIYYSGITSLLELMKMVYNLPKLLESYPKAALLVINSISFPFQAKHDLTMPARNALLEKIKQVFTVIASKGLAIVTTSQLSTKILKADGSSGNFDTGAKGILVPQLGLAYLPGRAYRMILAANGNTHGVINLISTPGDPQGTKASRSALYEIVEGKVQ